MTNQDNTANIPPSELKRHQIAEKLVENGWEPVPLAHGKKGCFVPGWSTDPVNMEWFDDHPRAMRPGGIGIRSPGAIDLDIIDEDILFDVNDILEEVAGKSDLVRIGRAPRSMIVYGGEYGTSKSVKIEKDGQTAQVEVLGTGSQFAAYHIHPNTGQPYQWVGDREPLNTHVDDIPQITQAQVREFISQVNELLMDYADDEGWEVIANKPDSRGVGDPIPLDAVFLSNEHGEFSAEDVLGMRGKIRCGWAGCKHAADGGMWFCDGDAPVLYNFGTGQQHYVEGHSPDEHTLDSVQALGDGLAKLGLESAGTFLGREIPQEAPKLTPQQALDQLKQEFVYNARTGRVWSIVSRLEYATVAKLREAFPQKLGVLNDKGKIDYVPVVSIWLNEKMNFQGLSFRPDLPDALWVPGEQAQRQDILLNTYQAPTFPAGGNADTFIRHIKRLVPDDREREIVYDWVAHLLSRPWERLGALLMVTPAYGTGRGLMCQAIERMLGLAYCRPITMTQLTQHGYQDQYNDWMTQQLFVYVGESRAGKENVGSDYRQDANAYEVLKDTLDVSARRLLIKRKGVANTVDPVFFSTFIASNHWNAIAIPDINDRRLMVIENCDTPLSQAQIDWFVAWMDEPANLGAVIEWAKARECTTYVDTSKVLDTTSKHRVINATRPRITDEIQVVLDNAPTFLITQGILTALLPGDLIGDANKQDAIINHYCTEQFTRLLPDDPSKQWKFKGEPVRPWVMKGASQADIDRVLNIRGGVSAELAKWSPANDLTGI